MKKLGFIALALVTTLASLGIGFSMWSQTVTVNGSVNTGSVKLTTSNYTGTWAWKDIDDVADETSPFVDLPNGLAFAQGAGYIGHEILPQDLTESGSSILNVPNLQPYYTNASGIDHSLIGFAEFTNVTNPLSLTATWDNIFPVPTTLPAGTSFYGWTVDFDLTNSGTIPVKIELNTATLLPPATTGTTPAISVTYKDANGATQLLEGYQIEPNQVIHVVITIGVDEGTMQSYTNGSFSLNIVGVQWNEYSANHPGT
jgi:hypothetical protein